MKKINISKIALALILIGALMISLFCIYNLSFQECKAVEDIESINLIQKENLMISSIIDIETAKVKEKIDNDFPKKEVKEVEKKAEEKPKFYPLTTSEKELILNIVTGEAGNQPYWGKVAVASCILNACLKDNIRPYEVKTLYGYSGYKSIKDFEKECMRAYGNTNLSDEIYQAVEQVFDRGEVYSSNMYWFYNPNYGYSSFHESMNHIVTIGEHKFFGY